jgi:hypothetical protein
MIATITRVQATTLAMVANCAAVAEGVQASLAVNYVVARAVGSLNAQNNLRLPAATVTKDWRPLYKWMRRKLDV